MRSRKGFEINDIFECSDVRVITILSYRCIIVNKTESAVTSNTVVSVVITVFWRRISVVLVDLGSSQYLGWPVWARGDILVGNSGSTVKKIEIDISRI